MRGRLGAAEITELNYRNLHHGRNRHGAAIGARGLHGTCGRSPSQAHTHLTCDTVTASKARLAPTARPLAGALRPKAMAHVARSGEVAGSAVGASDAMPAEEARASRNTPPHSPRRDVHASNVVLSARSQSGEVNPATLESDACNASNRRHGRSLPPVDATPPMGSSPLPSQTTAKVLFPRLDTPPLDTSVRRVDLGSRKAGTEHACMLRDADVGTCGLCHRPTAVPPTRLCVHTAPDATTALVPGHLDPAAGAIVSRAGGRAARLPGSARHGTIASVSHALWLPSCVRGAR